MLKVRGHDMQKVQSDVSIQNSELCKISTVTLESMTTHSGLNLNNLWLTIEYLIAVSTVFTH